MVCASAVGYYGYNKGDTTFDETVRHTHTHTQRRAAGVLAVLTVSCCVVLWCGVEWEWGGLLGRGDSGVGG